MGRPVGEAHSLGRRLLAEAAGTFVLVTVGCGAIVVGGARLTNVGIAVAFGLAVAAMVAVVGPISGGHLNPAVTVAFAAGGRFPWSEVPGYILVQLGGATAAALALGILLGWGSGLGATVPAVGPLPAVALEGLTTAILMLVIALVGSSESGMGRFAAILIGAAVAVNASWNGPLTGASMNPARSFGPAVASGTWDHHWVYWVGPAVGAIATARIFGLIRRPGTDHQAGGASYGRASGSIVESRKPEGTMVAKVLFLCTGNSARSQMAEGFLRHYGADHFEAYSAGLEPRGVHPMAVRVMEERGIPLTGQRSKSVGEFLGRKHFGYLITLCDHADRNCPTTFPGVGQRLHWRFEDPAAFEGTEEDKLEAFRAVRDQIDERLRTWLEKDQGVEVAT